MFSGLKKLNRKNWWNILIYKKWCSGPEKIEFIDTKSAIFNTRLNKIKFGLLNALYIRTDIIKSHMHSFVSEYYLI
jgi:hypothetical protein